MSCCVVKQATFFKCRNCILIARIPVYDKADLLEIQISGLKEPTIISDFIINHFQ